MSTKESTKKPRLRDLSKPSFSMEEVRKHTTAESAWIVVDYKVYDCTPFLKGHPGGAESILLNAGTECTVEFEAIHSKKAWKMLEEYYIGELSDEHVEEATAQSSSNSLVALDPKRKLHFVLTEKHKLSADSYRLRFALPTSQHRLGLPVGQHMFFYAKIDGKTVMRAYTPTSSDHDLGYFDLVIKVYYSGVNPAYPDGGKMSQFLGSMNINDSIEVKGPLGHVHYLGSGKLSLHGNEMHVVKKFVMLCGGTGITPMFQILKAVLRDVDDKTQIVMLYANRTENDVLLHSELDDLVEANRSRIDIHHVLSKPGKNVKFQHYVGRLTHELIQKHVPRGDSEGVFALLCGPQGLLEEICAPSLKTLGYPEQKCIYF